MRILKYLFLLVLLSLVALTIFVATQKGDFTVERSQVINSPKNTVYNYVNDYKNWEDFGSWTLKDPATKFNYSVNSIGNGASYSWENQDGSGSITTLLTKENDSIRQKVDIDGTLSEVLLKFKDTTGGTKVTWKSKGKMSFSMKIYAAFNGGIEKIIGSIYEKSLANLNKTLDFELKTYATKIDGLSKKAGTYYLKQTFTTKISNIHKNARIVFYKINTFCRDNDIEISGKPFLLYYSYDVSLGLAKISFCVPIRNQISTSAGSDILSDKLEPFEAVKTTLTGDYSHINKAYEKAAVYINANKIIVAATFLRLEVLKTSRFDIKNPSKWETEIYVPLPPKVIPIVPENPIPIKATAPSIKTEPALEKEEEKSEF